MAGEFVSEKDFRVGLKKLLSSPPIEVVSLEGLAGSSDEATNGDLLDGVINKVDRSQHLQHLESLLNGSIPEPGDPDFDDVYEFIKSETFK